VMESGTKVDLFDVWGSSGINVYAVGFGSELNGTIVHFDGTQWTTVPGTNPGEIYFDVWGSGPDDVFVVGGFHREDVEAIPGVILHYDGKTWSRESVATQLPIVGIWGDDAGNVFAVGSNGTILNRTEVYR
jgi:hypothetical protein